jgi:molybdopterin-binding protein
MNYIKAHVEGIERSEHMHFLHCSSDTHNLNLIILGLDERVKKHSNVILGVKSTNVSVAKGNDIQVSIATQLQAVVQSMHCGELVCEVTLALGGFELISLMMKKTAEQMSLQVGDAVLALIKATDLSIVEVSDA